MANRSTLAISRDARTSILWKATSPQSPPRRQQLEDHNNKSSLTKRLPAADTSLVQL